MTARKLIVLDTAHGDVTATGLCFLELRKRAGVPL
jgi:hypothetical protein